MEEEAIEKNCYYFIKDDETSCQNIVIKGSKSDPFCGEECHDRYKTENFKEQPKSRFEEFLLRGKRKQKELL